MPSRISLVALLVFALAVVACAEDHTAHQAGGPEATHAMTGEVPGTAGDPVDADRTVRVVASDALAFKPASIRVGEGEIITFVIRNRGKIEHEFVLGDRAYQEMHEADMQEGHPMMDTTNAVSLAPGEKKELTWTFSESGEVLFGCHQPGHYEGGMVGTITVS
ncbi:MAG: plastocyanin/azurin family copper-binding protein [Actinomycetota bacterium]